MEFVVLAAPVLAFVGSALAPAVTRRLGMSEETMRLLRWAVEMAHSADERESASGVDTLTALVEVRRVHGRDRLFVRRVTEAVARNVSP